MNDSNQPQPQSKAILERFARFVESLRAPIKGLMIHTKPAPKMTYGMDGELHRARRLQALQITGQADTVGNDYRQARQKAHRNRRAQRSASR